MTMEVAELKGKLRDNAQALKEVATSLREQCANQEKEREVYDDITAALRLKQYDLGRFKDEIESLGPIPQASLALRLMDFDVEAYKVKYNKEPAKVSAAEGRAGSPPPAAKKTTGSSSQKKQWWREGDEWKDETPKEPLPKTWHVYFPRLGKSVDGYTGAILDVAHHLENYHPDKLAEIKEALLGYGGRLPDCPDKRGLDMLKKSEFITDGSLLRVVHKPKSEADRQQRGDAADVLDLLDKRIVSETLRGVLSDSPLRHKHDGSVNAQVGEALLVRAESTMEEKFGSSGLIPRTNDIIQLIGERQALQKALSLKSKNRVVDPGQHVHNALNASAALDSLGLKDLGRTDESRDLFGR